MRETDETRMEKKPLYIIANAVTANCVGASISSQKKELEGTVMV